MRIWSLAEMDARPSGPAVLASHPEGRAIAIELPAGDEMGEHEVHERAWLVVAEGRIEVDAGGSPREMGAGALAMFERGERHAVRALDDSRLLLLLTPWPAEDRRHERAAAAET